eukprot:Opistho-2@42458
MKKKTLSLLLLSAIGLSPMTSFSQKGTAPADAIIANSSTAVVQTVFGKVRGYIHKSTYTYKGIPYAESERFMPPSKPKPWSDVRSSMTYGPVCPMDATTSVNAHVLCVDT